MDNRKVKVAIASDFLQSFANIPKSKQTKVMDFVTKFRSNPESSGINYEKINATKDKNLRSVRIDRDYRGIVLKPEAGNVFVLLRVDKHDDAYRWAENKIYKVNPANGSLQILDAKTIEETEEYESRPVGSQGLFKDIRNKHLARLGVPEEMLPVINAIDTEVQLEEMGDKLPEEAFDALLMLAAGYGIDEVFDELTLSREPVGADLDDYASALETPESKRRFFVVEDELELAAILNAPLEKWRVFLHPSQRKLVERDWNGPVRVLGGAGTGKTVVAIHRAKWLAQQSIEKDFSKILFTTFTRNLAADIRSNLEKICTQEQLSKIEVVNLDKWVVNFLRNNGYEFDILYGPRKNELWEAACNFIPDDLEFSELFYRQEWEQIVQQFNIKTLYEYFKVPRIGRGTRLTRQTKKQIWPVFEEYRLLLDEQGLREAEDAMLDATEIIQARNELLQYSSIVVDEAQDMSPQAYKLIRNLIPGGDQTNDIFVVGDAHQRIYRHKVVMSHTGINIRGRSRKLRLNYRTTEENRNWAVALLKGITFDDLDGGSDNLDGYKSLLKGVKPFIYSYKSFDKEIEEIMNYLEILVTQQKGYNNTCLVTRTTDILMQYKKQLESRGISTYQIKRDQEEDRGNNGLRLATMHRVKGLEFDNILIVNVNDGYIPLNNNYQYDDQKIKQYYDNLERSLFYVAVTRAKKEVFISSNDTPSAYLK